MPVAPVGETAAVNVIDIPVVADVTDGISVVVRAPVVLAAPQVLPPNPVIRRGEQQAPSTGRKVGSVVER